MNMFRSNWPARGSSSAVHAAAGRWLAWSAVAWALAGFIPGRAETTNSATGANTNRAAVALAPATTNAPAAAPAVMDFGAFRSIAERNVFNAGRSSRSARAVDRPARRPEVETFSVVGLMSYGKGDLAFFDGSSSRYRKAVKIGELIAGHKVVAIGTNDVQLELGEKKVFLKLGAQMRREDQGPWESAGGSSTAEATSLLAGSGTNSIPSAESGTAESNPDGGSSGEVSDALKRLLQKREKELQNESR